LVMGICTSGMPLTTFIKMKWGWYNAKKLFRYLILEIYIC